MKLAEVPKSFREKFVLPPQGLDARGKERATVFISPEVTDSRGSFPSSPMRLIGAYPGDIVKLKENNGKEFILHRWEILISSARDIIKKWQSELFEKEADEFKRYIDQVRHTENMEQAAKILNRPPGGAVWAKLNKARNRGIPVPAWFK